MALAMAMVLVLAMSMTVFATATEGGGDGEGGEGGATPAATGNLTVDAKVSVTGFEKGDTVTAYQFITWVDGTGWKLADGITGITVDQVADGLTVAELATLAGQTDKMTAVTGTTTGTTWEYTCGTMAKAGSYLILVADSKAEHIYNPAVVSADFDGTNSAAVDLTADAAMLKKQDVTVKKEADHAPDDYDVQVGDIVPFTVTVTVPVYNANWTEPYFAVSDKLSTGLTLETVPAIEGLIRGTDYNITAKGAKGDDGFTITFTDTYLKKNARKVIEIKYSAKVGEAVKDNAQVHEETNKVTLEFSNNPSNSSDHKTIEDETHHYTFAIDATRLGQGSKKTNELLKVGVDANGNPITTIKEGATLPTGVSPLAGAEFTLTGTGPNGEGTTVLTATSDADGRILIANLDAGTYYLKETKAPDGYIMDLTPKKIEIKAYFQTNVEVTEYWNGTAWISQEDYDKLDATAKADCQAYTYKTDVLDKYEVVIDGKTTSTFEFSNKAGTTDVEFVDEGTTELPSTFVNTKGVQLPSTGGIGTTIFYVIGAILVLGAGVLLVTRRRMSAN